MIVALTGATGFIGRYIVRQLIDNGQRCRCWYRPQSNRDGFGSYNDAIDWVEGDLADTAATARLIEGADAVVHGALYRPGAGFRGAEGDVVEFSRRNVLGSVMLMQGAFERRIPRFIFISTCAVHEVILEDRKLDEAHPMWPQSHYGAHKAALEGFVYSYGLGQDYNICALRPTGVYGLHHVPEHSKWHALVKAVARGDLSGVGGGGGKEVHAADVAKAVDILLYADGTAGQAYNCYDQYVSQEQVARLAAALSHHDLPIADTNTGPKHHIDTSKIHSLGMVFGGSELLENTVAELLAC